MNKKNEKCIKEKHVGWHARRAVVSLLADRRAFGDLELEQIPSQR